MLIIGQIRRQAYTHFTPALYFDYIVIVREYALGSKWEALAVTMHDARSWHETHNA